MYTLDEMDDITPESTKGSATVCDPCQDYSSWNPYNHSRGESITGHMYLINENGVGVYKVMTDDGRLVNAEEWMGYGG